MTTVPTLDLKADDSVCNTMKIKLGLVGNGFVGGAALQLECDDNEIRMFDLDEEKCVPLGTKLEDVAVCDIILVAVPTPQNPNGTCHTGILEEAINSLKAINPSANIVIRSTVPPGTSKMFGTHFMPEFLTEKNSSQDFVDSSLWVLGHNTELDEFHLDTVIDNAYKAGKIKSNEMVKMTTSEAEMVKYVKNCFLGLKVSFFNEVYDTCNKYDCDFELVRSTSTEDSRVGVSHSFVPGPDGKKGFGGHCFPKDLASWCTWAENPLIVAAAVERNTTIDRPEKDWEADKGRAVV